MCGSASERILACSSGLIGFGASVMVRFPKKLGIALTDPGAPRKAVIVMPRESLAKRVGSALTLPALCEQLHDRAAQLGDTITRSCGRRDDFRIRRRPRRQRLLQAV